MIIKKLLAFFAMSSLISGTAFPLSIPSFFSDNMVLQQNSAVKIWGWGKSKEPVEVTTSWDSARYKTVCDNNANWHVIVKTPSFGGPFTVTVKGYNQIEIKNVMIGEVWLCSGQSNMEWSANMGIDNAQTEISQAQFPNIRFFSTDHRTSTSVQDNLGGRWTECTPETMSNFSALAYFFARRLQTVMGNIPIGLINSSWGGTPVEVWIPEEKILSDPYLKKGSDLIGPMEWGPNQPGRTFNTMIAPWVGYEIAGVIWYQGETNTGNPAYYQQMLTTLITSWREKWNRDFPFFYAQIAPWNYGDKFQGAEVRNAQRKTLAVPNTGMIVTSDFCDTSNIHPTNKQEAGLRMANQALAKHYKLISFEVDGPLFKDIQVFGNSIQVNFTHAEGLKCTGKKITWFELAGEDNVYYNADAEISGTSVVVKSAKVKSPKFVRYAWRSTALPNLVNGMGLPMSCFISE